MYIFINIYRRNFLLCWYNCTTFGKHIPKHLLIGMQICVASFTKVKTWSLSISGTTIQEVLIKNNTHAHSHLLIGTITIISRKLTDFWWKYYQSQTHWLALMKQIPIISSLIGTDETSTNHKFTDWQWWS